MGLFEEWVPFSDEIYKGKMTSSDGMLWWEKSDTENKSEDKSLWY